jgi:CBS domain containing-hemolysin-like protein
MSILLLLAVFVLVLLNGFFVAAEFAYVRSRRGTLEAEAQQGKRGAGAAITIIDDLSRYLSSCQLGITLTSLGIGFLGEPAVADLVEPLFGDLSHNLTSRSASRCRRSTRSSAPSRSRASSRAR